MNALNLATLFLLFSSPLLASSDSQVQTTRFQWSLNTLDQLFSQFDKENADASLAEIVQSVQRGPRRVAAFNLQALGQVYQKYEIPGSKDFFKNSIRFEAKALEDAIGGVDKWKTALNEAYKEDAFDKIQSAREELNKALEVLTLVLSGERSTYLNSPAQWTEDTHKFLTQWDEGKKESAYSSLEWVTSEPQLAQKMKADIDSYEWLPYPEDRKFVISSVIDHLEDLLETEFNFELLEDTETEKGLHEFRREVRWYTFQAQNLNGTINFFDTTGSAPYCPSQELAELTDAKHYPSLAKSPYNKLRQTPFPEIEDVCPISRCLHYKMNYVVSQIGAIKDKVEKGNFVKGGGNSTPKKEALAAQRIYQDLLKSQAIAGLIDQLKACVE